MTQDPAAAFPVPQDTPSEQRVAPPAWYRDAAGEMTWWDGSRWVEPSTETKPDPTWSIFSHLSWFVLPILCPLLVRVIRGRRDPYSKHHSSEALNAHITYLVLLLVLIGSVLITASRNPGAGAPGWLVGVAILIGVLATVAWTVFSIVGTVQASRGKWWRYPASHTTGARSHQNAAGRSIARSLTASALPGQTDLRRREAQSRRPTSSHRRPPAAPAPSAGAAAVLTPRRLPPTNTTAQLELELEEGGRHPARGAPHARHRRWRRLVRDRQNRHHGCGGPHGEGLPRRGCQTVLSRWRRWRPSRAGSHTPARSSRC